MRFLSLGCPCRNSETNRTEKDAQPPILSISRLPTPKNCRIFFVCGSLPSWHYNLSQSNGKTSVSLYTAPAPFGFAFVSLLRNAEFAKDRRHAHSYTALPDSGVFPRFAVHCVSG